MDRLEQLRIFVEIARTGSLTETAKQLNMQKSAVSTSLKALEHALGMMLFERSTRHVTLTSDATPLLQKAEQLLLDYAVFTEAAQPADNMSGPIRLNMPSRIATRLIMPALSGLLARYPALAIDLQIYDGKSHIRQEGIDIAIRVGENSLMDDFVGRKVGEMQFASYQHVGNTAMADVGYYHDWTVASSGKVAQLQVDSTEAYFQALICGLGRVTLPDFEVRSLLAAGTVEQTGEASFWLPVYLLYPYRQNVSLKTRTLLVWLEQQLADAVRSPETTGK